MTSKERIERDTMTKARSNAQTKFLNLLATVVCTAFSAAWLTIPLTLAIAWALR
ncbi:hypothetical protein [Arthrobacter sp. 2MCAF14]|uniref:hypothetical protein n=1 Tax=Arthrobacter sp. 2MCAF14 TaxID=3232982 RepID=UPI003F8F0F3C